jgi:hypothetical protein
MKVEDVVKTLKGSLIAGGLSDRTVGAVVANDLMSDVLLDDSEDILLLTSLASDQAIRTANIVGAMIFQATIVFTLGILLTNWQFSKILTINFILTIIGALAFLASILKFKKITLAMLLFCGIIYFAYFVFVFTK